MKNKIAFSVLAGLSTLMFAAPAFAATISTSMNIGTKSGDVATLQQTFAGDASIYPEGLVTGYFGSLSSAAVKRFQAAQGIVSSGSPSTTGYGRVGPMTIAKFNAVYGNVGVSTGAPIISGVNVALSNNGATVLWNTNNAATSVVFYSTSPLSITEAAGPRQAPVISGTNVMTMNSSSNTSNSVSLANVATKTTYYYTIMSTDAAGNVSLTWPSFFTTN